MPADTLAAYSWETELCHHSGRYNPRKYSKEELDNVQKLLFGNAMLNTNTTVYRPDDLGKANTDTLTAEYTRQIRLYRTMRVVPQPMWLMLKRQAIQEVEDDYKVHKLYVAAVANPAILLNASPSSCKKYIEGLATSNDSLTLRNWRGFVEEQKLRSGSSSPYTERYNRESNSPDHLRYAKVELLTFGWFNCMNTSTQRVKPTEEMYRQFSQLFSDVTTKCDDVE